MCCDLKPRPDWLDPRGGVRRGRRQRADARAGGRRSRPSTASTWRRPSSARRRPRASGPRTTTTTCRLSHHVATLAREPPSVRRLVFASSYLVYDPALYLFDEPQSRADRRCTETDPVRPRNLCGGAKLMHEQELDFPRAVPRHAVHLGLGPDLPRLRPRLEGRGLALGALADRRPGDPLAAYRTEGFFDYIYAGDVAEGLLRLGASDATGVSTWAAASARRVSSCSRSWPRASPGRPGARSPPTSPSRPTRPTSPG